MAQLWGGEFGESRVGKGSRKRGRDRRQSKPTQPPANDNLRRKKKDGSCAKNRGKISVTVKNLDFFDFEPRKKKAGRKKKAAVQGEKIGGGSNANAGENVREMEKTRLMRGPETIIGGQKVPK